MYAEDMVIDIPQMWLNLAQLITPLLIGGSISMLKVVSVLSESMDKRCTAILLAQIMLQVKEKSVSLFLNHSYSASIQPVVVTM